MKNPAFISLKNVNRCFSKTAAFCAVDNLSLNIHADEILEITGRSGAGKSALIRCLNGLEQIDTGSIFLTV
ncbi:Methionine import ATP-binding protein MetN [Bartonella quintana]|uniref:Methionine import ATP-binding protein MetN n=1 Tax=Bartonella quintana JK 68 TaxID=1134503 RepID=A0ABR4SNC4_BARQI|nr:methionine import ATP-binding protein MetN [Bartonella quintana JK 68]KEC64912.1 methionine import ATP-binding protein MetN [Bartonella quintana JK 67]SQF96346.1 Methionine import ATP-binding protein MetN [Bartonella quintana]